MGDTVTFVGRAYEFPESNAEVGTTTVHKIARMLSPVRPAFSVLHLCLRRSRPGWAVSAPRHRTATSATLRAPWQMAALSTPPIAYGSSLAPSLVAIAQMQPSVSVAIS